MAASLSVQESVECPHARAWEPGQSGRPASHAALPSPRPSPRATSVQKSSQKVPGLLLLEHLAAPLAVWLGRYSRSCRGAGWRSVGAQAWRPRPPRGSAQRHVRLWHAGYYRHAVWWAHRPFRTRATCPEHRSHWRCPRQHLQYMSAVHVTPAHA